MSDEQEFRSQYLNEPPDFTAMKELDDAAKEYVRRVEEYERQLGVTGYDSEVSYFAMQLVRDIAERRQLDRKELQHRIQEIQRRRER